MPHERIFTRYLVFSVAMLHSMQIPCVFSLPFSCLSLSVCLNSQLVRCSFACWSERDLETVTFILSNNKNRRCHFALNHNPMWINSSIINSIMGFCALFAVWKKTGWCDAIESQKLRLTIAKETLTKPIIIYIDYE